MTRIAPVRIVSKTKKQNKVNPGTGELTSVLSAGWDLVQSNHQSSGVLEKEGSRKN